MSVRVVYYVRTTTFDHPSQSSIALEAQIESLSNALAETVNCFPFTGILTVGRNYYHDANPHCHGCTDVNCDAPKPAEHPPGSYLCGACWEWKTEPMGTLTDAHKHSWKVCQSCIAFLWTTRQPFAQEDDPEPSDTQLRLDEEAIANRIIERLKQDAGMRELVIYPDAVTCPYCHIPIYGVKENIDSSLRKHLEYCEERPM
jgi:hypothetical protein